MATTEIEDVDIVDVVVDDDDDDVVVVVDDENKNGDLNKTASEDEVVNGMNLNSSIATELLLRRQVQQEELSQQKAYKESLINTAKSHFTIEQINDIYVGRCKDNGEKPKREIMLAFRQLFIDRSVTDLIDIKGMRLGSFAMLSLQKALRPGSDAYNFYTGLNLYGNLVRNTGMSSVVELLKTNSNIKSINIGCNDLNSRCSTMLADALSHNNTLEHFQIGADDEHWYDNHFDGNGIAMILKSLIVNNNNNNNNSSNNDNNKSSAIISLNLSRNILDTNAAIAIAEILKTNRKLKYLDVGYMQCKHSSAILIFDALCNNNNNNDNNNNNNKNNNNNNNNNNIQELFSERTLETLNFRYNDLQAELGVNIGKMLMNNSSLTELNLEGNNLFPKGCESIASSLATNSNLQVLNLLGNKIGDIGAIAISVTLRVNRRLKQLNISSNNIGPSGLKEINKSLGVNESLQKLDMSKNDMRGNDTTAELSQSLSVNSESKLTYLDISSTKIDNNAAYTIVSSLSTQRRVRVLKMSDNFISSSTALKILTLCEENKSISSLDMSRNQISHAILLQISRQCKKNRIDNKNLEAELKKEISRLRLQQEALPGMKDSLKIAMQRNKELNNQIMTNRMRLDYLALEEKSAKDEWQREFDKEYKKLTSITTKLQEKQNEYSEMVKEMDEKIEEVTSQVTHNASIREELEEKFNATYDNFISTRDSLQVKKKDIEKEIEDTKEVTLKYKQEAEDAQLAYLELKQMARMAINITTLPT